MARRSWIALMSMTIVIAAGCGSTTAPSASVASVPPGVSSPSVASSSAPPSIGGSSAAASAAPATQPTAASSAEPFVLRSTAFQEGKAIPRDATCDGADRSPTLTWSGAPAGTTALVLVVDDPDARGFVHWLALDLPGGAAGALPQGVPSNAPAPQQGRNDFGRVGWGGPCPPSGTHHYDFTLTAVAAPLGLAGHPDGRAVQAALKKAKVLGQATLSGTYKRG